MTIIEKMISDKTEYTNSLKPKYYLIKGYLSTFLSLQTLNIILIPVMFTFLNFVLLKSTVTDLNIEETMRIVIVFLIQFFLVVFSFDFRFSFKILEKWFGIYDYKSALIDLSVLKENKNVYFSEN